MINAAPKPPPPPPPKPKPKPRLTFSKARLAGSFTTAARVNSASGINVKPGSTLHLTWEFTPQCSAGSCGTRMTFKFVHPSLDPHTARVSLSRSGASYAGSSRATLVECSVEDVYGMMRIQLRVTNGVWINGRWRATHFTGTMRFEASAATAALGSIRCPAASFRSTVGGSLER